MEHSAHGAIGATDRLQETRDMPQLNTKQGKSYRMLLMVATLVAHKLETWLQDLLIATLEQDFPGQIFLEPGMHNCAMYVE